jgi:anthranilate synthase
MFDSKPEVVRQHFVTPAGVGIQRVEEVRPGTRSGSDAIEAVVDALDEHRGAVFASTCEVPGRYARWDRGFVDPPIAIETRERRMAITALNDRGRVLLPVFCRSAAQTPAASVLDATDSCVRLEVEAFAGHFSEEERSRQPSVFSLLRSFIASFAAEDDHELGLFGAFGYDLAFQFEPMALVHERALDQRDLVVYLPDEIVVVDHRRERSHVIRYEFCVDGTTTTGTPRSGSRCPYRASPLSRGADHEPGEYAQVVRRAKAAFARGDLFEAVPSQVFSEGSPSSPSAIFRRLRTRNPSPYGFLVNLGAGEYLVGASPEMYVRVEGIRASAEGRGGQRVETCPIAGTIERGRSPLEDADQILSLLASEKDACELTMCTDVDRNDKSRVCEPGSVRVIGRRQIELYSKLIHTVDHVEGVLRPELDALDAFQSHTWAVTVTGAPKHAAMRFIEAHELSPRRWYGGAVGHLGFDGSLDTGLVLRTIRIADGIAETRVGATLLFDSDPDQEEQETRLKASALLDAIRRRDDRCASSPRVSAEPVGTGKRVLLVDAQDSFVHTLADYFRQTGARVKTLRAGFPTDDLRGTEPDLVVLSPGPGRPADFGLAGIIEEAMRLELPLFGVCLGLQAIVEFAGGELGVLTEPVHGKASRIRVLGGSLFRGLPRDFRAGRYHSLYARRDSLPAELAVTAVDERDLVMAVEHTTLPLCAVQFHPESILTLGDGVGRRLIENCVCSLPIRPRDRISRVWGAG